MRSLQEGGVPKPRVRERSSQSSWSGAAHVGATLSQETARRSRSRKNRVSDRAKILAFYSQFSQIICFRVRQTLNEMRTDHIAHVSLFQEEFSIPLAVSTPLPSYLPVEEGGKAGEDRDTKILLLCEGLQRGKSCLGFRHRKALRRNSSCSRPRLRVSHMLPTASTWLSVPCEVGLQKRMKTHATLSLLHIFGFVFPS